MCVIKKSIFPTSSAAGNNTKLMLTPNLSFLSCNYTSNYTCAGVFTHVRNAKEAFGKAKFKIIAVKTSQGTTADLNSWWSPESDRREYDNNKAPGRNLNSAFHKG